MHPLDYDDVSHRTSSGPSSTTINSSTNPSSGIGGHTNVGVKTEKENKIHIDHTSSSNNNNEKSSGTSTSGSSSIGGQTSQMSLRQALFTYFLPIYLAWFGGIFSELL